MRVGLRRESEGAPVEATEEWVVRPGEEVPVSRIAESVLRRLDERGDVVRPVPGQSAVVFASGTSGVLVHEVVGHGLEADTVLRGGSALARLEGASLPKDLFVMDDPRRGRNPWRWDDEGEEAQPTPLVREGRVVGQVSDLYTARASGRTPTGHGRRSSYAEPVRPRMGCTFLATSRLSPDDVIASTRSGVYVRRMESAGTDPGSGVAYFRVTDADRVHEGRIEAPLIPFLVRVALPDALTSLDRIADDLAFDRCIGSCVRDGQPLATSVGGPTCRVGLATIIL
jgi:TldD protein